MRLEWFEGRRSLTFLTFGCFFRASLFGHLLEHLVDSLTINVDVLCLGSRGFDLVHLGLLLVHAEES